MISFRSDDPGRDAEDPRDSRHDGSGGRDRGVNGGIARAPYQLGLFVIGTKRTGSVLSVSVPVAVRRKIRNS